MIDFNWVKYGTVGIFTRTHSISLLQIKQPVVTRRLSKKPELTENQTMRVQWYFLSLLWSRSHLLEIYWHTNLRRSLLRSGQSTHFQRGAKYCFGVFIYFTLESNTDFPSSSSTVVFTTEYASNVAVSVNNPTLSLHVAGLPFEYTLEYSANMQLSYWNVPSSWAL